MGEQKVSIVSNSRQMQRFVKHLLRDLEALEFMLDNDWFESDITRIGAEQEMVLVDKGSCKPAPLAIEALDLMKGYDFVETELAKFNLEINLDPQVFEKNCLSLLEKQLTSHLNKINDKVDQLNASVVLTGILPTLRKYDLDMHNMTPKRRYAALMEAINQQLIGNAYELRLLGIDELIVKHNSPMLEACNTSFQVHLQVAPNDFVHMYNIAQVLSAPVISVAANSPIVFGRRLWHESRIALFQQSLDTRSSHEHMRERSPRVSFGSGWLRNSILDIYREDIARFRVLISGDVEEDSLTMIRDKKVPKLRALQVHNSTVYRWNRPCYGISDNGKPHLRIENRVLPSGPTVPDEMANAALWLGAMVAYADKYQDITEHMKWMDVRDNFGKAARYGLETKFNWLDGKLLSAQELLLEELIPMARIGLQKMRVKPDDIEKYMGILQKRTEKMANGAHWLIKAYSNLLEKVPRDEAACLLTGAIYKNQKLKIPVHEWPLPNTDAIIDYSPSRLRVDEFMTTDLFTVQKDDVIDLVADMMNWEKIRYMPVEDNKGKLVGLITSRLLLRHFVRLRRIRSQKTVLVKDVMIENPITVAPEATISEAMNIMRDNKIGCLPVVKNDDLVGIITEMDFLRISSRLIEGHS